ncbi:MAG: ABC transporter permease [Gemmatimonadaceae bacterium]
MTHPLSAFLEGTIRTATPLALAALGEVVVERAGVINIGLEGAILCGAFGAMVGADMAGAAGGVVLAVGAGMSVALVFALTAIVVRTEQIIAGTAVTLLSLGLTGSLYQWLYGSKGVELSAPTMSPVELPLLSGIPVVGRMLFAQAPLTYATYLLVPLLWWWLHRTHTGLALRAVGESPTAAMAGGISPRRVQGFAVVFGGVMAGLAGASLVLGQTGTFVEGMSSGRGFIAIAIVVLGRWHPVGVAAAALLFGAASAMQYLFQSLGTKLPYQFFLAVPYLLTLACLAGATGSARPPSALGRRDLADS